MIDTHAHIYHTQFDSDRNEMITRAQIAGIQAIIMPNINLDSIAGMLQLHHDYPTYCLPTLGLHPCDVQADYASVLNKMFAGFIDKSSLVGIGETGLDLYWRKDNLEDQIKAFRIQAEWSVHLQLPLIIHARDSGDEILKCLKQWSDLKIRGVWHCFSGSKQQAEKALDLGLYLGIGGVSTFKSSTLIETIQHVGIQNIVLETDAPYLAPTPHRGQRNEPAYTAIILQNIANQLQQEKEVIEKQTIENTYRLFSSLPINLNEIHTPNQ